MKKFLLFLLGALVFAIGVFMLVNFQTPLTPPFMSGLAFVFIGLAIFLSIPSSCQKKKEASDS